MNEGENYMDPNKIKGYMLSLKYEDFTKDFIETTFCKHFDVKTKKMINPEISFQDEFILKKGEYLNESDVKTNVGQMIVNKVLYGNIPRIQKVLGYIAKPYDKGLIEDTEEKLAEALLAEEITSDDYINYLDNIQWLGNTFNTHVSCSFTPNTSKVIPEVEKKRKELFTKYKAEIDAGDTVKGAEIEDELVKTAKDALKNDVGMTIYDSGCKPKFGNQYKACFITQGPIFDPAKEKTKIVKSAFIDGVGKEDIAISGTTVINGAYPKAVGTMVAGYESKKLCTCYQSIVLDKRGSNCGSTRTRTVTVTKKNVTALINRYYYNNGKLEKITTKKAHTLVGKTIKIRSPLYCIGKKLCNMCAGDTPYILGIENIGLTAAGIGGNLVNINMKGFHDTTVKLSTINPDDIVLD